MDKQEKKMVGLTAHMEGQSVVVKNIGKMKKVSQMELICLCNFAKIGLFSLFAELEGEVGQEASAALDTLKRLIKDEFGNDGNPDGLDRLGQSTAAILGQDRLGQYVV